MKTLQFLKKLSVSIITVAMLTGCASLADTKVVIHDENSIDASITIAYDKGESGSESIDWKKALDEATSDKPAETEVSDYETDTLIGRTYTIKDKPLIEQQKWILSSMKGGDITKEDGKFKGVFYFDSRNDTAQKMLFSVTTPGKMENAPGATIDSNTATWDLKNSPEKLEFSGQASNGNTGLIVGLIVGSVLIAGAIWFFSRRKTPSPATSSTITPST